MPVKIVENSLDDVPAPLRDLYIQQNDGSFQLDLADLNSHVETHLKPLKSELAVSREAERTTLLDLGFGAALRKAGIRPNHEHLMIANFEESISLETVDGKRVVRFKDADGYSFPGSGPGGSATFDDLATKAVEKFPSVFMAGRKPASGGEPSNLAPIDRMNAARSAAPVPPIDQATVSKHVDNAALMKLPPIERMNVARAKSKKG
jgi:hypothetical protein